MGNAASGGRLEVKTFDLGRSFKEAPADEECKAPFCEPLVSCAVIAEMREVALLVDGRATLAIESMYVERNP